MWTAMLVAVAVGVLVATEGGLVVGVSDLVDAVAATVAGRRRARQECRPSRSSSSSSRQSNHVYGLSLLAPMVRILMVPEGTDP